jgi:hypothetical protein
MCSEILPFFRIIALGDFFPRLLCSYNASKRLFNPGLTYTGSTSLPNKSAKIICAMTYHAFSAQSISSYPATLVKLQRHYGTYTTPTTLWNCKIMVVKPEPAKLTTAGFPNFCSAIIGIPP